MFPTRTFACVPRGPVQARGKLGTPWPTFTDGANDTWQSLVVDLRVVLCLGLELDELLVERAELDACELDSCALQ